MANIQEDVTSQAWELLLKFLGTGTEFVCQITHEGNVLLRQGSNFTKELLVAMINKQKEMGLPTDATAQMLKREQKGETIQSIPVPEEDAKELSEYLQKKNILFNVIENPADDIKFFNYMSGDSKAVSNVIARWKADRGLVSELEPDVFLDNFTEEGVGTLSGLDRVDLELFRRYAKEAGLVFSSTSTNEEGKYMVVYEPKDRPAAQRVMGTVAWALAGTDGALLREQMVIFMKNRQQLNRAFLEAEKEYYIVSGKNPLHYVHLTANDFTYYKDTKEIKVGQRTSDDFLARGMRVVDGLDQPILLTREEFEVFKEDGTLDKEAIVQTAAEKANLLPTLEALREAQDLRNQKLERIQEKLALDDENTAGFWIYDDSIDFAAGGSYEGVEDLDEQIKADLEAARERAKQYQFHEVHAVDKRSLDYYIAEAEKQRKQPDRDTQEKEQSR